MAVEARLLTVARAAGLAVPEVLVADDGSYLGTPGLVMARVDGETVARRIQRKIDWTPPPDLRVDAQAFLQAFYTAQRGRLEAQVLLGKRRKDKHDRGAAGAGKR